MPMPTFASSLSRLGEKGSAIFSLAIIPAEILFLSVLHYLRTAIYPGPDNSSYSGLVSTSMKVCRYGTGIVPVQAMNSIELIKPENHV